MAAQSSPTNFGIFRLSTFSVRQILKFLLLLPAFFGLFYNFLVYSIDTIFILGKGLTRLLLRWYLLLLR
jgi:hypothetical protein